MSEGLLVVAIGAGMLAAVNPCGFALLPAYVSLLLAGSDSLSRPAAAGRAAALSVAMTSGFAGVFAVFGLVVSPVAGPAATAPAVVHRRPRGDACTDGRVAGSGPLAGEQLTAVEHLDTFWFAWAAFQPETRLVATR